MQIVLQAFLGNTFLKEIGIRARMTKFDMTERSELIDHYGEEVVNKANELGIRLALPTTPSDFCGL